MRDSTADTLNTGGCRSITYATVGPDWLHPATIIDIRPWRVIGPRDRDPRAADRDPEPFERRDALDLARRDLRHSGYRRSVRRRLGVPLTGWRGELCSVRSSAAFPALK
ncbi:MULTISPECIES: hypothetical protein [unclassified Streptomyces]|uniref:hypothetical protein n=1 Tax=unclassified Streptomyces TaxID=2593676 RepID=UPI0011CE6695|nr:MULTISPECIES: hypothetical protein [unclassified Streptomyces]TXS60761.1 hypothetical protein EAO69_41220 [Streptomyces sp. me109]